VIHLECVVFMYGGRWLKRHGHLRDQVWSALAKLCRRRTGLCICDVVLEPLDAGDDDGPPVAVHVFATESFGDDPELIGDFVYEALLEDLAPEYATQLELGRSEEIDCEVLV